MTHSGSPWLDAGVRSASAAGEERGGMDQRAGTPREHGERNGARPADHRSAIEYCVANDLI